MIHVDNGGLGGHRILIHISIRHSWRGRGKASAYVCDLINSLVCPADSGQFVSRMNVFRSHLFFAAYCKSITLNSPPPSEVLQKAQHFFLFICLQIYCTVTYERGDEINPLEIKKHTQQLGRAQI